MNADVVDGNLDQVLENQLVYWRAQLAGISALELPTDRTRPAVWSTATGVVEFGVPTTVVAGLREFAAASDTSLSAAALAVFQVLLSRWSGQDDISVGTPATTLNTLVIRADLSVNPTFSELAKKVEETVLAAQAHRDLPFERLIEELAPECDLSRNPLCQVHFELGERLRSVGPSDVARFDLDLTLQLDADGALVGELQFATALFDRTTVERLAGHLVQAFASAGSDPHQPVTDVDLVSVVERGVLLGWNDTTMPFEQAPVHELVQAQVARTPDAVALVCGEDSLTYRELNAHANQLAHHLMGRGAAAGTLVAVCLERSVDMVVAVLGILKAGAAYVPLDPDYPPQRLQFMLQDTSAPLVVTHTDLTEHFADKGTELVVLDRDRQHITSLPDTDPHAQTAPNSLAYIIYTSGSTGVPKGVMIQHGNLVNYVLWSKDSYPGASGRGSFLHSSLAFDLTVTSVFVPLVQGGFVEVIPTDGAEGGAALADRVFDGGSATLLKITPAHLELLVSEAARSGRSAEVGSVVVGGEALSTELAMKARAVFGPGSTVVNEYGPTEATVGCVVYSVNESDTGAFVLIGRPIANTEVFVMDRFGKLAPLGVPGELWIGGAGVARGYWNREELTAEKFVAHPFNDDPTARLYRTGDLVRWLPDGTLEFLGRIDNQVKLRGFRIELGEIESALLAHEHVSSAVVIVREDTPGDKRLVAYCVMASDATLDATQLRGWCLRTLPDYMTPGYYVELDSIPLTLNGKVDRQALPAPDNNRSEASTAFVAPRTDIERAIAAIWSDVLGIDNIGIHDNFFTLGGHSLLAMRVVGRLVKDLRLKVPRNLFQHPTVAAIAQGLEVAESDPVTAVKRGLEAVGESGPVLATGIRPERIPLSFAQQRLWFMDQLEPNSSEYVIPLAFRLTGPLDVAALESAFNALVARHEVLRTRFLADEQGVPAQVVDRPWPVEIDITDLTCETEREQLASDLVNSEVVRPFDLTCGRLLRASLVQLAADEHLLLVSMHHIAADGWSLGVLTRELRELYQSAAEGRASELADLPVQYADYALWQHEWLTGDILEQQLDYWRAQLAGLETLELPTDRPRPAVRSHAGDAVEITIPPHLVAGLRAVAANHGASLFMVATAAFHVVLSRWSGQDDIAIGTPIAGRNRPEVEDLIGFFVNTLIMRADLSHNPTFSQLIDQVKETAVAAYTHQDLPFERLVEELAPERDLSRNPLIQVMIVQEPRDKSVRLAGVDVQTVRADVASARLDLTLHVDEDKQDLPIRLVYSTDLFTERTMIRFGEHLRTVLAGIAANAELRISQVDLVSVVERGVLLGWNDTTMPFEQAPVHELVQAQVARTPDAVALVCGEDSLTYRELNAHANQLAHHLMGRGAAAGTLVAVCLERSVDMVVAVLGILKAGAAYVPLDPDYPPQRLQFMLQDTSAPLVVTHTDLTEHFADKGTELVVLDRDRQHITSLPDTDPHAQTAPNSLAYIIYTSGSTGVPKGVMIQHGNLVNYVLWSKDSYPGASGRGSFLHSSLAFDLTVTSVFVPLVQGGFVEVIPTDGAEGGAALADRVFDGGSATLLKITPAHLELLVSEAARSGRSAEVGSVVVGGEALSTELAMKARAVFGPGSTVVNEYGPTEATVGCVVYSVNESDTGAFVLIGRPIANTEVFVMDRFGKLAPLGVPGELWIGGAGVARGYWNREELTAEKFVAHPFNDDPTARLYRTGDLVRWLPDGTLEFLGRIDNQVKLRGFRIELGEIESALLAHEHVSSAVVIVREDTPGDKRLVAYCVMASDATLDATQLRGWCLRTLPDYMTPGYYVELDSIPLTLNGKVDRQALPAPDNNRSEASTAFVAPRTDIERAIAAIWSDVLGIDNIGIHDNFFTLGGHSLLAMRVINRMVKDLQVEVSVRDVFQRPTLASIARGLEAVGESGPVLATGIRPERIPLSFAQQRLWFMDQLEPNSSEYVIPLAFRLTGPLDVAALESAFNALVARHEVLRTRFLADEQGVPAQVVDRPWPVEIDITDLTCETEREQLASDLVNSEVVRPFDLTCGRLLRASLVQLAADEHLLLVSMHHIAADGWSLGVLTRELRELYQSAAEGRASELADLPVQYADYALWQHEWLTGDILEQQLDYWRAQLAGLETLELPTDRPRPAVRSHAGDAVEITIPPHLVAGLRAVAANHGASLFMVATAAFHVVLSRWSGQDDIAIGTPIAGRNRPEVEDLIGFFVNTLIMRADLSHNPTFSQLIDQVKETAVAAYTHQDLPFERLVEELAPERDLSRNPLIQVMIDLREQLDATDSEPCHGTRWQLQSDGPSDVAKFDLDLTLQLDADGALVGELQFATALFDRTTVERLAGHLVQAFASAGSDPHQPVTDVDLVSVVERGVLLGWNDTTMPFEQAPVHELVQAQVARTPDAVALVCGEDSLTYRELNAHANQLAHHLMGRGAAAGTLVAVCLERSVDMVVAVLGILKAGAAYVPLDPDYPPQRLQFMLQDTSAPLVVTHTDLTEHFADKGTELVVLDRDRQHITSLPDTDPHAQTAPNSLAYIIYTSGSTGVPKGVMIQHRSFSVRIQEMRRRYEITANDRVLQFASISFDAAAEQIFPALISGGGVLIRGAELWLPEQTVRIVREVGITVAELTPNYWEQIIPYISDGTELGEGFRLMVLGGEAVPVGAIAEWFGRVSHPIYNTYGPTETTITATAHLITAADPKALIGRPIANTEVFVMDRFGKLAPLGVPGELWIGGAGVARGYWNREELTAEKFVAHPFNDDPTARLYRTGDLVRWLPDGTLEFLGRIDNQVKLRGFRIELGEIESALLAHEHVSSAVVIVREDTPGDKRLVAYCVMASDATLDATQLRGWCLRTLPDYMTPGYYVELDSIPLTLNGKVDRQALPAPDNNRSEASTAFVAPRTDIERAIAAIWSDVLGIDNIGIHDNFFTLGGHSLLATRVINRIELLAGVFVSIKEFFLAPTVEAVASYVIEAFE